MSASSNNAKRTAKTQFLLTVPFYRPDPATGYIPLDMRQDPATLKAVAWFTEHDGIVGVVIGTYFLSIHHDPEMPEADLVTIVEAFMAWSMTQDDLFVGRGTRVPTAYKKRPAPMKPRHP